MLLSHNVRFQALKVYLLKTGVIRQSTIQLLRFPFSWFLMPVFWFAVSFVEEVNVWRTLLVFIILHLLVYPSSNGYNSFMDRDEECIGGIEKPLQPTRQLFKVTLLLDAMAVAISFLVSGIFAGCVLMYIAFSRMYSYRGIRLKRYALIGFITVILVQGSLTFFMVYHGADMNLSVHMPMTPLLIAAFLIGGFYPITQVYQHKADAADGVHTISMRLGIKGTFVFCAVMYSLAMAQLFLYYRGHDMLKYFWVLILFFTPVLFYFLQWSSKVFRDTSKADFRHTMKMNWLASTCTSLAFIVIIIFKHFG